LAVCQDRYDVSDDGGDALDPDAIGGELLQVVDDTVAPAHASLWVRPG
jgi:hypothetical protein